MAKQLCFHFGSKHPKVCIRLVGVGTWCKVGHQRIHLVCNGSTGTFDITARWCDERPHEQTRDIDGQSNWCIDHHCCYCGNDHS